MNPVVKNGIAGGIGVNQLFFINTDMIYQIISMARTNNAIFY